MYEFVVLPELVFVQQMLLLVDHVGKLTIRHLFIKSIYLSDGVLALDTFQKVCLDLLDKVFQLLLFLSLVFYLRFHFDLELSSASCHLGLNFEPFFFGS